MSAKKPPEKPAALRFGHRFCIREAEADEIDHDVRAHGCDFFGEIRRFLAVQNGIFFLLPHRVLRVGAAFSALLLAVVRVRRGR